MSTTVNTWTQKLDNIMEKENVLYLKPLPSGRKVTSHYICKLPIIINKYEIYRDNSYYL